MSQRRIKYIGKDEIINIVDDIVSQSKKELSLPVDIEDLLLKYNINIVTHKDLKKNYDIESYIPPKSIDKIIIDDDIYMDDEVRARYTLAHEFGHYILHKDFIQKQGISSEKEYFGFRESITPQDEKRIEIQAHMFAGYILLPKACFRDKVDKEINMYGGNKYIGIVEFRDIMKNLTLQFHCSGSVALKQLEYEYPKLYEEMKAVFL